MTLPVSLKVNTFLFQPALPLRGVTPPADACLRREGISTRTPLAGSDLASYGLARQGHISTRTPLAGSDVDGVEMATNQVGFQPALPLRGVTQHHPFIVNLNLFQPALPLRGVTISPALAGSRLLFQPALPLRGVTATFCSFEPLSSTSCVAYKIQDGPSQPRAPKSKESRCEPPS